MKPKLPHQNMSKRHIFSVKSLNCSCYCAWHEIKMHLPGVPERTGAFKNGISHDLLGQITHSTHHCVAYSMLFYLVINTLAFVHTLFKSKASNERRSSSSPSSHFWVGRYEVLPQRPTTGGKIDTYCQNYLILRPLHLGNTTAAVTPI